jgi:hypothetical protein
MEPLPLEDAPPPLQPRSRPRSRLWPKLVFAFVCIALALGTFAFMRYRNAAVPDFAFREFASPDSTCKAILIGDPVEGTVTFAPGSPWILGGKQFSGSHWSTPVKTSLRWYDLAPEMGAVLRPEDVIAEEVKRREKELNAKIEKEGLVKWNEFTGRQVEFLEGRTRTVERYLFVNKGSRPRLYVISIGGSGLNADAAAIQKVLNSFQCSVFSVQ